MQSTIPLSQDEKKSQFLIQHYENALSLFKPPIDRYFLTQLLHLSLKSESSLLCCQHIAKFFIEKGADLNGGALGRTTENQKTMFMDLCQQGTLESIQCLIDYKGLNFQKKDGFKENALHYLLRRQSLESCQNIVQKILKRNEKMANTLGKDGKSLLMIAGRRTSYQIIKVLIKRRAQINYQCDVDGNSVLHEVIKNFNTGSEVQVQKCIELLIEKNGLNPLLKNKQGKTAFDEYFKWNNLFSKTQSILSRISSEKQKQNKDSEEKKQKQNSDCDDANIVNEVKREQKLNLNLQKLQNQEKIEEKKEKEELKREIISEIVNQKDPGEEAVKQEDKKDPEEEAVKQEDKQDPEEEAVKQEDKQDPEEEDQNVNLKKYQIYISQLEAAELKTQQQKNKIQQLKNENAPLLKSKKKYVEKVQEGVKKPDDSKKNSFTSNQYIETKQARQVSHQVEKKLKDLEKEYSQAKAVYENYVEDSSKFNAKMKKDFDHERRLQRLYKNYKDKESFYQQNIVYLEKKSQQYEELMHIQTITKPYFNQMNQYIDPEKLYFNQLVEEQKFYRREKQQNILTFEHSESSVFTEPKSVFTQSNKQLKLQQERLQQLFEKIESNEEYEIPEEPLQDDGYQSPREGNYKEVTFRQKFQILDIQMHQYMNCCFQEYQDMKPKLISAIQTLDKIAKQMQSNIVPYGSFEIKTWTPDSDLNLAIVPFQYKERKDQTDYRIFENAEKFVKKLFQKIKELGKDFTKVAFYPNFLPYDKKKQNLDRTKNPHIVFSFQKVRVNIVFQLNKKYLYHTTQEMKRFFTLNQHTYPVFFTLKTLLKSVGLMNEDCLRTYELFSLIYHFSWRFYTSNSALFLYKMLKYIRQQTIYEQNIDNITIQKSRIIETVYLKDPLNSRVNLFEGVNLSILLSRIDIIILQIEKCDTVQVLKSLFEVNKVLDRMPKNFSIQPASYQKEKQKYHERTKKMFKKRIEEDELRLKENSPKAKRRREVQIERRKKSFDNLWSEEEI